MKTLLTGAVLAGALGLASMPAAYAQQPAYAVATPPVTSPLSAAAGKDSNAINNPLPGGLNQGPIDPKTWKYGSAAAYNAAPGSKIWNPVKLKMMRGEKVTGGTVFNVSDATTYCAMANAGYDFIWTEMQHSSTDWDAAAKLWKSCPYSKAVPGARVAYADEREIQHAADSGALVIVVPTIDTVEEAIAARNWAFFPPLGRRSQGGGYAFGTEMYGSVPGGYRQTINDNLVLILMIETVEGVKNAAEIAKVPGVSAIFAASGDLGNFSGFAQNSPDYERLINAVHDAALNAGVRLCGPFAWRERPDFSCFQNQQQTGAIATGVKVELGALADTQGAPEVGPWAKLPAKP